MSNQRDRYTGGRAHDYIDSYTNRPEDEGLINKLLKKLYDQYGDVFNIDQRMKDASKSGWGDKYIEGAEHLSRNLKNLSPGDRMEYLMEQLLDRLNPNRVNQPYLDLEEEEENPNYIPHGYSEEEGLG